jgi:hypothetical protein
MHIDIHLRSTLLVASLLLPACSGGTSSILNEPGDDGGTTGSQGGNTPTGSLSTTSALSPETIDGVCAKYNSLSCAEPNCAAQFALVEQECSAESGVFQGLLNCLSVATFTCEAGSEGPVVPECTSQTEQAGVCTGGSGSVGPPSPTSSGSGTGPTMVEPGGCQTSSDCAAWSCLCNDGYSTMLADCSGGTCEGPTYVCSASNPDAVSACQSHGGVL